MEYKLFKNLILYVNVKIYFSFLKFAMCVKIEQFSIKPEKGLVKRWRILRIKKKGKLLIIIYK